jgi:multidrug efflux pump subunit AcrA (membrane-fusion protein)
MRLSIKADDSTWIPGMAVRVSVPTQKKSTQLVVPRDAMVIRRDGIYLFRVSDDNTVERLRVTTGSAAGDLIAVKGDLNAGDSIVIRGNERLRPGQFVKAISLQK